VEIDEERIAKALAHPLQWKVPNDFASVRRSQNTGTPLALENSTVSRTLHQMARAACGKTTDVEKKKKFGLF
jgi:Flp pilus assembly CpaE family ATPase